MPLISVIMPSYNHEHYISESIESVLNQTFRDFELIIIDDASVDKSKQIIENYAKKDRRIRDSFHEKNLGIARTLNDGISIASGKFIAFIASDDVWLENKLTEQLDILKNNDDVIVWSEGELIDKNGKSMNKKFTEYCYANNMKKCGNIYYDLLEYNYILASSLILKKNNLNGINFNENLKYLNDYQFVLDLSKVYEYHFINKCLVEYRIHGNNSILSDKEGWDLDRIKNYKYIIDTYIGDNKKIKSRIMCNTSLIYFKLGDIKNSIKYMIGGVKLYPFNLYYISVAYIFNPTFHR